MIFLGAPHNGLHPSTLQTISNGQSSERLVDELKPGSSTLKDLSSSFPHAAQDRIKITSFYETLGTRTLVQMVRNVSTHAWLPCTLVLRLTKLQYRRRTAPGRVLDLTSGWSTLIRRSFAGKGRRQFLRIQTIMRRQRSRKDSRVFTAVSRMLSVMVSFV